MNPHHHFSALIHYHTWATRRLLDGLADVSDADYRRDVGLFFKSIHGTLNHLLLTDEQVWHRRFANGASAKVALDGEIEPDRERLAARLLASGARWQAFMTRCLPSVLMGRLIMSPAG